MAGKQRTITVKAPQNGAYPMTVSWSHVAEGIKVHKGDPLLDLKAGDGRDVRVRAPETGRIASPPYEKGSTIHAGMTLVLIGEVDPKPDAPADDAAPDAAGMSAEKVKVPESPPPASSPEESGPSPSRQAAPAPSSTSRSPAAGELRVQAGEAGVDRVSANPRQARPRRRVVPLTVYAILALAIWGGLGGIRLPATDRVVGYATALFETSEQKAYRECMAARARLEAEQKAAQAAAAAEGKAAFASPLPDCAPDTDTDTDGGFKFVRNKDPIAPEPERLLKPATPAPANTGADRDRSAEPFKIAFANRCNQPIKVAIRYLDQEGNWQSKGFWSIAPGQQRAVAMSTSRTFYYHAYGLNVQWHSNDHAFTVNDGKIPFNMRRWDIDRDFDAVYTHNLNCSGNPSGYVVRVANYCPEKLRVAARYVDKKTGEWVTSSAFAVPTGTRGTLIETSNPDVWVHASYGSKYLLQGSRKQAFKLQGKDMWFFPIGLDEIEKGYLGFCN